MHIPTETHYKILVAVAALKDGFCMADIRHYTQEGSGLVEQIFNQHYACLCKKRKNGQFLLKKEATKLLGLHLELYFTSLQTQKFVATLREAE